MRAALAGLAAGLLVCLVLGAAAVVWLSEGTAAVRPSPARSPSLAGSPGATSPAPGASASPTRSDPSGAGATASPSAPDVGLRVGDRAPGLSLPRLGGGRIEAAALRGRPLWVNFTASWCPPCRDELPFLDRARRRLGERLPIVVVDVRESPEVIASLVDELGVGLPVALDQDGAAQRDWGAWALPVHYWLDAEGRIRAVVYGGAGPEQFLEGIRSVVPGATLEP